MNHKHLLFSLLVLFVNICFAQSERPWKGKKSAVVLTYDDALNIHLNEVIPALDSLNLKGTFYLIGSSPVVASRINEWRAAARTGHELGNHTLNHPCDGTLTGRDFVSKENDLSRYTVDRAVNEIRVTNTLLKAIDGKQHRTFAYPCGDLTIGDSLFYNSLKNDFAAARGVMSGYVQPKTDDLSNVLSFAQHQNTGEQMIAQVQEAQRTGSLIVFLFHGVGGEHSLNVSSSEHKKLLTYLKSNEKDIWVAPLVDVALEIKRQANSVK